MEKYSRFRDRGTVTPDLPSDLPSDQFNSNKTIRIWHSTIFPSPIRALGHPSTIPHIPLQPASPSPNISRDQLLLRPAMAPGRLAGQESRAMAYPRHTRNMVDRSPSRRREARCTSKQLAAPASPWHRDRLLQHLSSRRPLPRRHLRSPLHRVLP